MLTIDEKSHLISLRELFPSAEGTPAMILKGVERAHRNALRLCRSANKLSRDTRKERSREVMDGLRTLLGVGEVERLGVFLSVDGMKPPLRIPIENVPQETYECMMHDSENVFLFPFHTDSNDLEYSDTSAPIETDDIKHMGRLAEIFGCDPKQVATADGVKILRDAHNEAVRICKNDAKQKPDKTSRQVQDAIDPLRELFGADNFKRVGACVWVQRDHHPLAVEIARVPHELVEGFAHNKELVFLWPPRDK